jgi:hypothetical protein
MTLMKQTLKENRNTLVDNNKLLKSSKCFMRIVPLLMLMCFFVSCFGFAYQKRIFKDYLLN